MHSAVLIILEDLEPPGGGLEVEILDEGPRYLHVGHHDALPRVAPLETVLEGQVPLNVRPERPDDRVPEEAPDELPVVVGEDISEDQKAFLAESCVELFTGRSLILVLLL